MVRSEIVFCFFNDTATTEIYTLSLHDALPILYEGAGTARRQGTPRERLLAAVCYATVGRGEVLAGGRKVVGLAQRSEEHTSELQSRQYLVCRLLLEKKNSRPTPTPSPFHTRRR